MRNFLRLAAGLGVCAGGALTGWQDAPKTCPVEKWAEAIARSEKHIQRFMARKGVPGLSVGVSVDGRGVWARGFGWSDVEQLVECRAETAMRIASISKPITAALVARLRDEGRLDWDAPVHQYCPDFPQKTFQDRPVVITTRQLLAHLGGIRHYKAEQAPDTETKEINNSKEYYWTKQYDKVTDSLEMFKDDPLVADPGSKYIYTTFGWTLVSAVAEAAGGESFQSQIKRMLSELSMHSTYLDENPKILPFRSKYYKRNADGELKNVPEVNNSYKWAGGGLVSTVGDLLNFAHVMLYSRQRAKDSPTGYIRPDTVEIMWTPETDTDVRGRRYGLGWELKERKPPSGPSAPWNRSGYICHTGGAVGASSAILIAPNANGPAPSGVCVVILTNLESCGELRQLAEEIATEFQ